MAKERKIPTFTPAEQEQIDSIQQRVLNSPGEPAPAKPAGEPTAKPKIWEMFNKGGKVKNYCKGGKVISSSGR